MTSCWPTIRLPISAIKACRVAARVRAASASSWVTEALAEALADALADATRCAPAEGSFALAGTTETEADPMLAWVDSDTRRECHATDAAAKAFSVSKVLLLTERETGAPCAFPPHIILGTSVVAARIGV